MTDQAEILAQIYEQFRSQSRTGLIRHHSNLIVDVSPDPQPFEVCAYPFQKDRLRRIGPAVEHLCGIRPDYMGPTAFWEVASRGRDKTSGLGRIMNWVLAFSPRPLEIIACAADGKQVGFLISAMKRDVELNPWVAMDLKFVGTDERAKVTGPGGVLSIQPANAKSSWGGRQDMMILDEVTHWDSQGRKLWESVISARSKKPKQVTLIISNAGILDSWQHEAYQLIRGEIPNDKGVLEKFPDWETFEYPANIKTWMSAEQIARERQLIPKGTAKRVYDNIWINASEDSGYLEPEEINAAFELGKRMGLKAKTQGEPRKKYVAVVDYGGVKDRCACWVGHLEVPAPRVPPILVTDKLDVWCGVPGNPVKLQRVKDWIKEVNIAFNRPCFVIDQYQMEAVIQELENFIEIERFRFRGGQSNFEMAELLKSLFADNRVSIYEGCGHLLGTNETIKEELKNLVIERKTGLSYRFDHTKTKHDDRVVAMGMGALKLFSSPLFHPLGEVPLVKDKPTKPGFKGLTAGRKDGKLKIWGAG